MNREALRRLFRTTSKGGVYQKMKLRRCPEHDVLTLKGLVRCWKLVYTPEPQATLPKTYTLNMIWEGEWV